ncbi:protein unc-13 homolog [Musa acuminata AAA Group]|uniref:protein unc-13 homolog n=1 Tax=Musa acuminata AAA Group TaxID=214697 RepID=UPI0031DA106D
MGSRRRRSGSFSFMEEQPEEKEEEGELQWPFGRLDALGRDELRESAYELFVACCRFSQGSSGRAPPSRHPADGSDAGTKAGAGIMSATSRVKGALGLRGRLAAPMRTMVNSGSPVTLPSAAGTATALSPAGKQKQRPMTSAEIMRHQMGVTEQSDTRLRKTLMRFLAGQVGRQAETIILPLELLRHLRPPDFVDSNEYHRWQRRQLKILEAGLVLHSWAPCDRLNSSGLRLREILTASELKPIDTSKHSEAMRNVCNCVMALAWRYQNATPVEACHWADGFPFNIHLYLSLLRSIFDLKDKTVILDEVDELLELMKKTWATLGINKMVHTVCFTWVLFEQYVRTGLVEPDLMGATLALLDEVANDAMRPERESGYVKVLLPTMASLKAWAEKKLLDYHEALEKGGRIEMMDNVLCLAFSTAKIISEETSSNASVGMLLKLDTGGDADDFSPINCVDRFIRASLKCAFTKAQENCNGKVDSRVVDEEDPQEALIKLAKETEELALLEKENYSPLLKRWYPNPTAVAVVTLHSCYGAVLKQYLLKTSVLTNELVRVLHTAGNLEKVLIQMAAEDSAGAEGGGKGILSEMIPYQVDSIIFNLIKRWVDDRLRMARGCFNRAKETESWNPKSKSEPYAESAVDLMQLAKMTVDEFFEIQVEAKDELGRDLADGLDTLFKEYCSFAASCGSKESFIPALPPLTRCNQDSMVAQLWKRAAAPCTVGADPSLVLVCRPFPAPGDSTTNHRHTASRGTQRLCVRLNTLQYFLGCLHTIDESFSSHCSPLPSHRHFDGAHSSIHSVILHVAELAAFRLIFVDSSHSFYDSLYFGSVYHARIHPTLRVLNQNLTYLTSVLIDGAQPQAVCEVMKASFGAFLMVLLAGGSGRAFTRGDYDMLVEDFMSLKHMFLGCGKGLVAEEVVEQQAEVVEGVLALMRLPTEKLVEDFSIAACEASGLGRSLETVPMPPTTGKWHCSDPNTMLRVLCHRNDDAANRFLKKAFELPKRR